VIMDNFSYDFQPGERIGIIGKRNRKINFWTYWPDHFRLMVEKWWLRNNKSGVYILKVESTQNRDNA
jgi:hypothetical protein